MGNRHLLPYLKKLATEEKAFLMPVVQISAAGFHISSDFGQTKNFQYAFAPGWFETFQTAIIPLLVNGAGWRHANAIVCQIMPGGRAVQCLHFEPHGHFSDPSVRPWIQRRTEDALTKLCVREDRMQHRQENGSFFRASWPFQLVYHPVAESCPNVGPQKVETELLKKFHVDGLCAMHCLNMMKQALSFMTSNPGVAITPLVFRQISKQATEEIVSGLLMRTHSLLMLGGYRNNRIHNKNTVQRMSDDEKKKFLQAAGVKLSQSAYQQNPRGWIQDLADWATTPDFMKIRV